MSHQIADHVRELLPSTSELYHQLVLLVGPSGTGKTAALHVLNKREDSTLINVNLELSQQMLELTRRQRALKANQILGSIVASASKRLLLLDNLELLFDVALKLDPFRLIKSLSRNRTVVAALSGFVSADYFVYAEPGHPEYKQFSIKGVIVVRCSS